MSRLRCDRFYRQLINILSLGRDNGRYSFVHGQVQRHLTTILTLFFKLTVPPEIFNLEDPTATDSVLLSWELMHFGGNVGF